MAKKEKNWGGISSQAVQAKTGRGWDEWIKLLDKEKAFNLTHKEIAIIVSKKFGAGEWWAQMVTVGYEQAKGLRVVNEQAGGFTTSVSKTINASVERCFKLWADAKARKKWLSEKILIHNSTENKYLRITWTDGNKSVNVNFYPKGEFKSQVVVQHEKLKDTKAVAGMKNFWKEALLRLEVISETKK